MIRKIIGWFIVVVFLVALIVGYAIMIYENGWSIMLGLMLSFIIIGIFLFGVYLITKESK